MICRYTQFRLSNTEGAALSLWMRKHLRGCECCREFKGKLAGLDESLRGSAAWAPAPILADREKGRSWGRSWFPAFALGSFVAMAAAVALYFASDNGDTGTSVSVSAGDPAKLLNSEEKTTGEKHSDPLSPSPSPDPRPSGEGRSLISQQLRRFALLQSVSPLERELEALQQDGKRGLTRLLALGSTSNTPQ